MQKISQKDELLKILLNYYELFLYKKKDIFHSSECPGLIDISNHLTYSFFNLYYLLKLSIFY